MPAKEQTAEDSKVSKEKTTRTSKGFEYTYLREDWGAGRLPKEVRDLDPELSSGVTTAYLHHLDVDTINSRILSKDDVHKELNRLRDYATSVSAFYDIPFNAAITQTGDTYQLRGLDKRSAANYTKEGNDTGISYLLVLGRDEKPSPKMLKALQGLLEQQKKAYPNSNNVLAHRRAPGSTSRSRNEAIDLKLQNGSISFPQED